MHKRGRSVAVVFSSCLQIFLLVSMSFAVSFILSESVAAQTPNAPVPQQAAPTISPGGTLPPDRTIIDTPTPPPSSPSSLTNPSGVRTGLIKSPDSIIFSHDGQQYFYDADEARYFTADGSKSLPDVPVGATKIQGFSSTTGTSTYSWTSKGTFTLKGESVNGLAGTRTLNGVEQNVVNIKGSIYEVDANGVIGDKVGQGYYKEGPLGFGGTYNFFLGNLLEGVVWAATVVGVIQLLGALGGFDEELTKSLSLSAAGGIIGGKAAYGLFGKAIPGKAGSGGIWKQGLSPKAGIAIGVAIAVVIFLVTYKDEKTKTVSFQCLPWEPPIGGAQCEKCNQDPQQPCSEYRCKALGQACELVNKGSEKEQCVWVSRNDAMSPTITPLTSALSDGLSYKPLVARPTALGTRIVKGQEGCIEAFTPLVFGIQTNEPAQCKIDYEIKNYSEMQFFFGESNYYLLNHTQRMKLPSPRTDAGETAPLFKNDGTFNLYVRCQDANGNVNEDIYTVEFCVNKGPDTTPPVIESTSIITGSPIRYKADSTPFALFVNEPSQCKWSREDKAYDSMENVLSCDASAELINAELRYACETNLTGIIDRQNNEFFFRCRDTAGNTNVESMPLLLRGSQPLTILEVKPNGTIFGSTATVPVELEVLTDDGSDEGAAQCFYNTTLTEGYQKMFETDSFAHKQIQDLTSGNYKYAFRCIDAGGNIAEAQTSFTVVVDKDAPIVTRTYRDTALKIVTNEDAECTYSTQSCNFNLLEGIRMEYSNIQTKNALFAPWKPGQTYYIKCVDKYGNQPTPDVCSVLVSPRQFAQQS
ncbi:hypothetical protein HYZ97_04295 [Candidatus Pacearchaeota archaeon]|nr:hypothetical protein [Candidatus Pacearchaeota archaeon]